MKTIAIKFLMGVICVTYCIIGQEPFVDMQTCHVRLIKRKKKEFCYISFVEIDGILYLVKQKRQQGHLLAVVHDALAAYIAQSLGDDIAHKVMIIPAFHKFPGKIYDDWPATIHTLAVGATLKNKRSPYKKMNIKQACQGFRRDMIPWMAKHRQLIIIMALDIFLCNHDRHRGNLFYNAKTDSFCAIDMDCLYKYSLGLYAHQNVKRMAENDLFPLTIQETFALLELRNTLQFLVDRHSPQEMLSIFDDLVKQAGLTQDSLVCSARVQAEIDLSRNLINQNYHDVKEFIVVLGHIIQQVIVLQPVLRNFQIIEDFEKKQHEYR